MDDGTPAHLDAVERAIEEPAYAIERDTAHDVIGEGQVQHERHGFGFALEGRHVYLSAPSGAGIFPSATSSVCSMMKFMPK